MVESLGISVFRIRLVDLRHRRIARRAVRLALRAYEPLCQPGAVRSCAWASSICSWRSSAARDTFSGAVVGAALLTLLQNGLQDLLPHFARNGAQLEVIVFAVIYVLVLQFARGGVMPFVLRYLPQPR